MIRINLLPAELRRNAGARLSPSQKRKILLGVGFLFFVFTLVFYVQYQFHLKELKSLQTHWVSLQKDIQRVTAIQSQLESGSKKEKEFLEHSITSPFPITAILNAVSQFLPNSVWLIEIKIARQSPQNSFLLKGLSVPSNQKSSIQDIEKYLRDVKKVFPQQTEVILTTSRQMKDNRELTLFTAVFKWT